MQPVVYPPDMGGAWGITTPLPRQARQREYREFSDQIVAQLGACQEPAREASLADLAEAASSSISEVRLGLRRLAEQPAPAGIQLPPLSQGSGRGADLLIDQLVDRLGEVSFKPAPPPAPGSTGLLLALVEHLFKSLARGNR